MHDLGLAHDLQTIAARQYGRRRALQLFGAGSVAGLLIGCGGGSSDSASATTTGSTTVTPTPTTSTPTPTATPAPTSTTSCTIPASETAGPYPADGTNSSNGSTSNVLTASGIVRSDIRSSFLSTSTVAAGVQTALTLTVVDLNNSCQPLAGYAIYLWHCNALGQYSLYDLPNETYLRGVQVTDANGQATFTTFFPGCYAGRYPHMHFEIFSSLANASSGRYARLTSQLAMPADVANTVCASSTYGNSASRFAQTSISSDNVFGDNSAAQMVVMTPGFSGSAAAGYTAATTIAIAT